METRKWPVLVAFFYPFAITTMAAGLLAFVMILLKIDMLLIATIVLWFYFVCATSIYAVSKNVMKPLGVHNLFLGFTLTIGLLAALSTAIWILHG